MIESETRAESEFKRVAPAEPGLLNAETAASAFRLWKISSALFWLHSNLFWLHSN